MPVYEKNVTARANDAGLDLVVDSCPDYPYRLICVDGKTNYDNSFPSLEGADNAISDYVRDNASFLDGLNAPNAPMPHDDSFPDMTDLI